MKTMFQRAGSTTNQYPECFAAQVELLGTFLKSAKNGKAMCHQMILGPKLCLEWPPFCVSRKRNNT